MKHEMDRPPWRSTIDCLPWISGLFPDWTTGAFALWFWRQFRKGSTNCHHQCGSKCSATQQFEATITLQIRFLTTKYCSDSAENPTQYCTAQ